MPSLPSELRAVRALSALAVGLALLSTLLGQWHPLLLLTENQVLYLFSTSAQVIAGVFGLTLTGYIFLRNELDRQKDHDETVADAVDALKRQYYLFANFVSVLSVLTIFSCLTTLAVEDGSPGRVAVVVALNCSISLMVANLLAIIYFVVDIINPQKIEITSDALQVELGSQRDATRGDLETFLHTYNKIDRMLVNFVARSAAEELRSPGTLANNRIPRKRIPEMLLHDQLIDATTCQQLQAMIQFRNSLLHGTNLFVSRETVDLCIQLRNTLRVALQHTAPAAHGV